MASFRKRLTAGVRRRARHILMAGTATSAVPIVPSFTPGGELATIHHTREAVARIYLRGEGIEIGALHAPLKVPEEAHVKYVDRMAVTDLTAQYPELAARALVHVDIVDNGETLATIVDTSLNFAIANHFLEHCQNPFQALQNLARVLRPGGVIFMAVPDKRYSFDAERPCTTIEHLTRDYVEGPEGSKRAHFEEWSRLVNKNSDPAAVDQEIRHLMNIDYSIHFHVWGAAELLEFILALRPYINFEPELFLRNGPETIFVLRKTA